MPISAASIAAQAARFMEMAPISSFADDTPLAQDMADQYPIARQTCLEACDWSFASRVVALPPRVPGSFVPDDDLPFAYALPGDCVRLIHTVDQNIRWRIDGRLLRADFFGPLRVRYTADIEDESLMPRGFQTAVALQLAALLSPRWIGAESKTAALTDRAGQALRAAMRSDARSASAERYDGRYGDPDWVDYATGGGATRFVSRYASAPQVAPAPVPPPVPGGDGVATTDYAAIYDEAKK